MTYQDRIKMQLNSLPLRSHQLLLITRTADNDTFLFPICNKYTRDYKVFYSHACKQPQNLSTEYTKQTQNHLVSIPFNQRMRNKKDWHFLFNFRLYKDFTISGLLTASKRHALHLLTTLIHSPAQTATSWINKMNIFNNRKRNTS